MAHEYKKQELTIQQKLFCEEYLVDFNATQAAIRANYSEKTAYSQGNRLLKHVEARKYINKILEERSKTVMVSAEFVVRELLKVATADLSEAFDENGKLKPIHEIPKNVRMAIASIETDEIFDGFGEDRHKIGETKKIKFWNKMQSLDLLGKHLKMFTEKVEHSGDPDRPIIVEDRKQRMRDLLKNNPELADQAVNIARKLENGKFTPEN